jgi:hypothetical protein
MSNVTPFLPAYSAATSRSADRLTADHLTADRLSIADIGQPQHRPLSWELRAGLNQLKRELQAFRDDQAFFARNEGRR